MMKKLFALLVAGVVASTAFAQEAPDVLVQRVTEEVLEIIRNDREIQNGSTNKVIDLVDKKVLPHFNFQHMTALAMGKEWRKASPQQQQQLTAEFKTLLVRTYSNALTSYKNQKVDELFATAAAARTPELRQKLYTEVQTILMNEVANGVLFEIEYASFYPKNVKKLVKTGIGLNETFDDVYIEKK